jgi:hypothetical protein
VALLAFRTADALYGNTVHAAGLYIVVKLLVNAVKLVAAAVFRIVKNPLWKRGGS